MNYQLMILYLNQLDKWMWSYLLFFLLIGVGLFFTIRLKGMQFRYLGYSLKLAFTRSDEDAEGDISQFQALMTALAATIGIASIAGVATAIVAGGFGSIFWMWMIALVGMATKFVEAILAVKYREVDGKGRMCGGPMYYLANGLKLKWLGIVFSICCLLATLGGGNLIQAHSIAVACTELTSCAVVWPGIIMAILTAFVLFGGIKNIAKISSLLVPIMAFLYIVSGLFILCVHYDRIWDGFFTIVQTAFTGQAAVGGFLGSSVMMAIQLGAARGISSNEAGMGSAPIAAAAAKTDVPGRQALISMSGVFFSSFIVCTITALVIFVTNVLGTVGANGEVLNGVSLVIHAFRSVIPGGEFIVIIGVILFGYTTIIGWAYYGEKSMEFLCGESLKKSYRFFFCFCVFLGSTMSLEIVWPLADIMNGLMTLPNLIGLIGLSSIACKESQQFFQLLKQEKKAVLN